MKLWKVSERDRRPEGYNLKDDSGIMRDPTSITTLRVPVFKPMELMVEASPRRVFANAHTYHINSISVNSDQETYMSADDLRINLWHLEITDQSFSILFVMIGGGGGLYMNRVLSLHVQVCLLRNMVFVLPLLQFFSVTHGSRFVVACRCVFLLVAKHIFCLIVAFVF